MKLVNYTSEQLDQRVHNLSALNMFHPSVKKSSFVLWMIWQYIMKIDTQGALQLFICIRT